MDKIWSCTIYRWDLCCESYLKKEVIVMVNKRKLFVLCCVIAMGLVNIHEINAFSTYDIQDKNNFQMNNIRWTQYKHYSLKVKFDMFDQNTKEARLSFCSKYGTGIYPIVKNIKISVAE